MMKRNLILSALMLIALCVKGQQTATITFDVPTDKKVFFQTESDRITGYEAVKPGTTLTVQIDAPEYYYYVDTRSHFHTVYLTPGSDTRIAESAEGVTLSGTHADINRFISLHPARVNTPADVPLYSEQWVDYQRRYAREQTEALQASGLPADFVRYHTLYYRYSYLQQLIVSPETARVFQGRQLELPANYYDDVFASAYDDADLLTYPKWFTVLRKDLELREQQGRIAPDYRGFIARYAACIGSDEVKSAFLLRYLQLTLKAGYAEDFPAYLDQARAAVKQPSASYLQALDDLASQHEALHQKVAGFTRGTLMPTFTGVDVDGKTHSSADYAGQVWVLDFWFSGCIPCKAEMPYMEQLAEEFQGKGIQFFALSLDSGPQLMKAWTDLVKQKHGVELQLNIPGGFRSELAQHFGIRSVPRIVIVGQDGRIVDAFARRPSDPKLRQLLLELTGLSAPAGEPALTKDDATRAMMSLQRAGSAAEKEQIMKEFVDRVKRQKADFAYPMANMMLSLTIEALYVEGSTDKADQYMAMFQPSPFKRDIYFMAGARCMENDRWLQAETLLGEAARMTLSLNEGSTLTDEERQKYPVMFGFYGDALIHNGHVAEAVKPMHLAYEYSAEKDFRLNHNYAAVLMHEQNYAQAAPLIEELVIGGKGDERHAAWLKDCYVAEHGSTHGFAAYFDGLQARAANRRTDELKQRMVSIPAPAFELKDLSGATVSLAQFKGKVVVLDFWATWCGPCKASFPAMQKAVQHYADAPDVKFLFINTLDNKKNLATEVEKFITDRQYDFHVLFDPQDPATRKCPVVTAYGAKGIPAKYIIDKEGNIRFEVVGFSGSEAETVDELKAMIDLLR